MVRWRELIETTEHIHIEAADGTPILSGDGPFYLGGWPDDALWNRIIGQLADRQGLVIEALPAGLRVRDTATHRFAFNYGTEPQDYCGKTIQPAGVAWWDFVNTSRK